jgi:hypothetical protein
MIVVDALQSFKVIPPLLIAAGPAFFPAVVSDLRKGFPLSQGEKTDGCLCMTLSLADRCGISGAVEFPFYD